MIVLTVTCNSNIFKPLTESIWLEDAQIVDAHNYYNLMPYALMLLLKESQIVIMAWKDKNKEDNEKMREFYCNKEVILLQLIIFSTKNIFSQIKKGTLAIWLLNKEVLSKEEIKMKELGHLMDDT